MYIVKRVINNIIVDKKQFSKKIFAEKYFLDLCEITLSNWEEYTDYDIEAILEQGFEKFGSGFIKIEEV